MAATKANQEAGGTDDPGEVLGASSYLARWETIVSRSPDSVAAVGTGVSLTYAQVDHLATEVARRITEAIGSDPSPVALITDDAPAIAVGLIAVLRSGHPVLPIDPLTTPGRTLGILELAGPALGLRPPTFTVPPELQDTIAWIDLPVGDRPGEHAEASGRPSAGGRLGDIVALLFTSGSTGRPKGVRWRNATMLGETWGAEEVLGIGPGDRVGLALPPAFAAGFTVAAFALASGATLVAIDPRRVGASALTDWVDAERITTLHGTPTLLRALVSSLPDDRVLPSLRMVTCSGEPMLSTDVEAVRPHLDSSAVVVNWAGASEVGTLAFHVVDVGAELCPGPLPVGLTPPGKVVHLLSEDGTEAAAGATGEVLVVAHTLTAGYVDPDADLTGRFQVRASGGRSYRSGDLARRNTRGELELRGRQDDAVKIGGYLVEPAEVETVLRQHPLVVEAVVIADRTNPTRPRLSAYIGVSDAGHLSGAELRRHARDRLPVWMVPSSIVFLPHLPRNERGKVDRTALPPPPARECSREPGTPTESALTDLWREVLGVEEIGMDDDFITLGGDSLAAVDLLAGVAATFGVAAPTSMLLEAPTVAELARCIDEQTSTRHGTHRSDSRKRRIVRLRAGGDEMPVIFLPGSSGVPLEFVPLVRRLRPQRPAFALPVHALEQRGLPDWSVSQGARRYLRELRAARVDGPFVLIGHSLGGLVAIDLARRLRLAGESVPLVVLLDSHPSGRLHGDAKTGRKAPSAEEDASMGRLSRLLALLSVDRETPGNVARVLAAGPIRFDGLEHYEAFYRRGMVLTQLHRTRQYDGQVVLVVAADDPVQIDTDSWRGLLGERLQIVPVAGDHTGILHEPHVASVAAAIESALAPPRP